MNSKTSIVCLGIVLFSVGESARAIDWQYSVIKGEASINYSSTYQYAFQVNYPSGITIPATIDGYPVTRIGDSAFSGCAGMSWIVIPDTVTKIGDNVFDGCSGLRKITIPLSVTNISYNAFAGLPGPVSIEVDPKWSSRLSSLKNFGYVVPYGVTEIGDYAFDDFSGLTSVWIRNNVTNIGERAFSYCSRLTSITNWGTGRIGTLAFWNCSKLTSVDIPDAVTEIGYGAFSDCSGLMSVMIGNGVKDIGRSAFQGCSGLQSITIPGTVANIGAEAFQGCSGLQSLTIPGTVANIGADAFRGCSGLASITISEGVKHIGCRAFSYCSGLTSIAIPGSVTNIDESVFSECARLSSISVQPSNPVYDSRNGCQAILRTKDGMLVAGCVNTRIPDGVTSIGAYAFSGCSDLTSIEIPDGVTSIGAGAFNDCSMLASINLPNGVTNIASWAFADCRALRSIALPDSVTTIGDYAFSDCSMLAAMTIPDAVTSIGDAAFHRCSWLESITIPAGVKNIGEQTFFGCRALVLIPDGVKTIGRQAFSDATMSCLAVPDSVKSIEWNAFDADISTLYLPKRFENETEFLGIRSSCSVVFYDDLSFLYVFSKMGNPFPGKGLIPLQEGSVVSCNSGPPLIPDEETNGVAHACSGWKGTGSVPENGTETNVVFSMTETSSLTWMWKTMYRFGGTVCGAVSFQFPLEWRESGGDFAIPLPAGMSHVGVFPASGVDFSELSMGENGISVPTDKPREFSIEVVDMTVGCDPSTFPLFFELGGDACWKTVERKGADGTDCLSSGAIGSSASSWSEIKIAGPGRLSFDWRVSCNSRGHYGQFLVDGIQQQRITGQTDWATVELDVPDGEHVLRWNYEKGSTSAQGEDALFLDGLKWVPKIRLDVQSAFGSSVPAPGTTWLDYGTPVAASVSEPAAENGTRRVCTGWRGTGSVPSSGSAVSCSFAMKRASFLEWLWRTDYWIDVTASGDGTIDFSPQWVEDGSEVRIRVSSDAEFFSVALEGDTDGVKLNGGEIVFVANRPRAFSVVVTEEKNVLTVVSKHGTASPAAGRHGIPKGRVVSASVSDPEPTNGVRYVCTGWIGTGSVPPTGTTTNVTFRFEEDSCLTWLWKTNVWIEFGTAGPVATEFASGWTEIGSTVSVSFEPLANPPFDWALSGDTDGTSMDEQTKTVSVPADRPRDLSLSLFPWTLGKALDATGLSWTSDDPGAWSPQADASEAGGAAARSGAVLGDDASVLRTMVSGPGTLSWKWSLVSSGNAGVDVFLDGAVVDGLYETTGGWIDGALSVSGSGTHEIRFEFWNAGTESDIGDHAMLDRVSWTGAAPPVATETSPEPVPVRWIEANAPDLFARVGGDYEAAANAVAANGRPLWECYVAGLDPADPADDFRVDISFDDDRPVVTFDPDLGAARDYAVEGKRTLPDGWGTADGDSRFFRATVSLPSGYAPGVSDDGFPGAVVVTFDPNGGTVSPPSKRYLSPGVLGDLPVPVFGECDFNGWHLGSMSGFPCSRETPVPWRNINLVAKWISCTIQFHANGAIGEMEPQVCEPGAPVALSSVGFSKTGCRFAGWARTPDGPVDYADRQEVDTGTPEFGKTVDLFAIWIADVKYRINSDGTATVTGFNSISEELIVPSALDGHPVVAISHDAFSHCSELTSVVIPESVTSIEFNAFGDCSNLVSVTISNGLTTIGNYAFQFCPELTTIAIPDSVTDIGNQVFRGCSGLTSLSVNPGNPVFDSRDGCNAIIRTSDGDLIAGCKNTVIPDGVTSIGDCSFRYCSGLTSITIPASVTRIGWSAFEDCSSLKSITIPDGVTSIEDDAFSGCSELTSITIPDSVTGIGGRAFDRCSSVEETIVSASVFLRFSSGLPGYRERTVPYSGGELTIGYVPSPGRPWCVVLGSSNLSGFLDFDEFGYQIVRIGDDAFRYVYLTSIIIPEGVTSIGDWAFYNSFIRSISIPEGVTSVGVYAFADNDELTSISIPDSMTSIGLYAFDGCSDELFDVTTIPGLQLVDGWAIDCTNSLSGELDLTGLRGIAPYAFCNCTELTSILLPDGLPSIPSHAFDGCKKLVSISIPDSVTSVGDGAFAWCSSLTSLSLPRRFEGLTGKMGIPDGCTVTFRD